MRDTSQDYFSRNELSGIGLFADYLHVKCTLKVIKLTCKKTWMMDCIMNQTDYIELFWGLKSMTYAHLNHMYASIVCTTLYVYYIL